MGKCGGGAAGKEGLSKLRQPGGPGHGDRGVDGEDREDVRGSAEAKCQQAKGKKIGLNNKMRKGTGKGSKTW